MHRSNNKGLTLQFSSHSSTQMLVIYNENKVRQIKASPTFECNYVLDGNNIIRSIHTTPTKETIIDYHYDELQQVCGLNYNGVEYFYQRDLTGNINYIIDKQGKVIVQYSYTAFGVPSKEIGALLTSEEESIANVLMEHNIYLYKGYCYDAETSLYYCNTRYYDPEIGRWISADDVSYLDPESINGLNLFAYCGNNPVMNIDSSGCAWYNPFSWTQEDWQLAGKIALTVGIVSVLVATVVLTGGATAALTATFGGTFWGAVGAGALVGAASGAIMSGGFSIIQQGLTNGYDDINWSSVGKSALIGAATGALFGGAANGLKHYLTSAVKAAEALLNSASNYLNSIPNVSKGGTIAANRLAAQMSYNAAQNLLWRAQYNLSIIVAKNTIYSGVAKLGLNYFIGNL